jgi:hypothetical protein
MNFIDPNVRDAFRVSARDRFMSAGPTTALRPVDGGFRTATLRVSGGVTQLPSLAAAV